jgi:outer membrane protein assembly factor BamB
VIRFRLGQQWKREPGAENPLDAFGLELDGVELLAGASEEPLAQVVPSLVEAVVALQGGERTAEVSLHEAHFELCFVRISSTEVELSVVSLARPARLVHPALIIDLPGLLEATARCARQWAKDAAEAAPALLGSPAARALNKRLRTLERGLVAAPTELDPGRWRWESFPRSDGELSVVMSDSDGRSLAFHRRSTAPLPSLMCAGEVAVRGTRFRQVAPPFLTLLELTRRALNEGGESTGLGEGEVVSSRAIFEGTLEWCVAMGARNPALSANPHLEALTDRCTRGLTALRPIAPGSTSKGPEIRSEGPDRPLPVVGALRRLRFEPRWERSTEVGDHGQLVLTRRGPVVLSPHAAWAFDGGGKSLHRRVDTHGVAVADDGTVIAANSARVTAFAAGKTEASWFRDHDAVTIGPRLVRAGQIWITSLAGRGVMAYSAITGRELWRLDPPRSQRGYFSVVGDRVLLATDGGSLYGLELSDGQARFRIRASLPFHFPAVAHGRRALGVLCRADRSVAFLTEVRPTRPEVVPGAVVWTHEFALARPCPPVVVRGITYVAGQHEDRAVVIAISRKGEQRWERTVPLLGARMALVSNGRGVIACDARGAAVSVSADGQLEWVLGAAGDELADLPLPALRRGVLVVAGEKIRAVDPRGGRVLAELQAGRGLLDVAIDGRLNVYALDDSGVLRAWKLGTTLAVV